MCGTLAQIAAQLCFLVCERENFPGERGVQKKEREDTSIFIFIFTPERARIHSFTKKKSDDFIGRVAIRSRRRGIGSKTREEDELGASVHDEWWF
jgi:hypothetical protein